MFRSQIPITVPLTSFSTFTVFTHSHFVFPVSMSSFKPFQEHLSAFVALLLELKHTHTVLVLLHYIGLSFYSKTMWNILLLFEIHVFGRDLFSRRRTRAQS